MIKFYVGQKGSGKTLNMVYDAQWFFLRGFNIFSNFPCWGYCRTRGFFRPLDKILSSYMYPEELESKIKTSFESKKPTLFLLDEAPVMYNSREWKNFDLDLIYAINQSRKSNVHLFMSAQRFHAVDKQLRETANFVYLCEKMLFKPLRLFTVMVVDPDYFKEEQESVFLKKYIKKRKFRFEFSLSNYYKFFDTEQLILPQRFFAKYPNLFQDPKYVTVLDIISKAKLHKELEPPI